MGGWVGCELLDPMGIEKIDGEGEGGLNELLNCMGGWVGGWVGGGREGGLYELFNCMGGWVGWRKRRRFQ